MSLLPEEEYVESGYFAATDYVGGIALGEADTTTTYVEEGYIVDDYFRPGGGAFSLSATLSLAIQLGEAELASAFGISVDADKIKQTSVTMTSSFSMEHPENGGSGPGANPVVTLDGAATINSSATMSTTPGKITQGNVNIAGAFAATMNVIATMTGDILMQANITMSTTAELIVDLSGLLEYFADLNAQAAATIGATATIDSSFTTDISADVIIQGASELVSTTLLQVFEPGIRPHVPTDINSSPQFNTFTKQFGTHSLNIVGDPLNNQNQYIEYTLKDTDLSLSNKSTSAFHFEAWIRGSIFIDAWAGDRTSGDNPLWRLATTSSTALFYTAQTQNNNDAERLTGTGINSGSLNHIAVRIEGSSAAIYINGSRTDSYTSMTTSTGTSVMYLTIGQNEQYLTPSNFGNSYIDDLRILRGTASELDTITGYSTTDTSITVPTSANINNTNTKILLHFDGNFRDDDSGVKEYLATINSVASLTGDVEKIVEADAGINSVAGLSATGDKIKISGATLISNTSLTATPEKILEGNSDLSVVATVIAGAGTIKQGDVDLPSIASQLTAASMIGDFFVNADCNFSLSTSGLKTAGADATINAVSSMSSTPTITRRSDVDMSVVAELSVEGSKTLFAEANFNSTATLGATGSRTRNTSATLAGFFAQLTVGDKSTINGATLNSEFAVSVEATKISNGGATLNSEFDVNFGGGIVADASATLEGFFAILSVNKILHVDEYVFKIPNENREYRIQSESREYSVTQENRLYKLKGAA